MGPWSMIVLLMSCWTCWTACIVTTSMRSVRHSCLETRGPTGHVHGREGVQRGELANVGCCVICWYRDRAVFQGCIAVCGNHKLVSLCCCCALLGSVRMNADSDTSELMAIANRERVGELWM
jgi:hypothetical protein